MSESRRSVDKNVELVTRSRIADACTDKTARDRDLGRVGQRGAGLVRRDALRMAWPRSPRHNPREFANASRSLFSAPNADNKRRCPSIPRRAGQFIVAHAFLPRALLMPMPRHPDPQDKLKDLFARPLTWLLMQMIGHAGYDNSLLE